MSRFTPVKLLPLILSTLLLTSCSGPDSSGGVEFSKTDNSFPYGDCRGSGYQTHSTEKTGCGWIKSYYIMPDANLTRADLSRADLSYANLTRADLSYANVNWANLTNANLTSANLNAYLNYANLNDANLSNANLSYANLPDANLTGANLSNVILINPDLSGVLVNSSTICPNGKPWGVGNNVSCQAAGFPQGPTSNPSVTLSLKMMIFRKQWCPLSIPQQPMGQDWEIA